MPDMEQLYAWTETDEDGYEGVIAAMIPLIGRWVPLQHNRLDVVLRFEPHAQAHAQKTDHRVRLVRFARAETLKNGEPK